MSTDRRSPGWAIKLLMGIVVNLAFFGALEIGLRLYGFEYSRFPRLMLDRSISEYIAWQKNHIVMQHFVPHRCECGRRSPASER